MLIEEWCPSCCGPMKKHNTQLSTFYQCKKCHKRYEAMYPGKLREIRIGGIIVGLFNITAYEERRKKWPRKWR